MQRMTATSSTDNGAPGEQRLPPCSRTLREDVRTFVREAVEAAMYVYVILLVTDKPIDIAKIARIATLVGLIQTAMLHFDQETHAKIREGMTFSLGSSFIGGF